MLTKVLINYMYSFMHSDLAQSVTPLEIKNRGSSLEVQAWPCAPFFILVKNFFFSILDSELWLIFYYLLYFFSYFFYIYKSLITHIISCPITAHCCITKMYVDSICIHITYWTSIDQWTWNNSQSKSIYIFILTQNYLKYKRSMPGINKK